MHLLVLSPHYDDAAFSLGLSIACWLQCGHTITVVNCFTRSEYAPYADDVHLHPNDRMSRVTALRQKEDETWRRLYKGKLQTLALGLKDAPLRLHIDVQEVCAHEVNPADKAFAKIRRAIEQTKAQALLIPLALGQHVDHLTTRDAALLARGPDLPCAFYEDLPYAARPNVAETIEACAGIVDVDVSAVFASEPLDPANAVLRKHRLALCYDSQIEDDVLDQIASFCLRYDGRERLWANRAWKQSELATRN